VSFSGGSGQIPVQALLKLTLDTAGAETIQKFLDGHEQQWSRIEGSINRISSGVQGITRFGMDALGVAGIGALAQNFISSSTAGSNVALAAGHATGGSSAWHPYSQAMLSAQAKTGVPNTQIAQGMVLAIQSVGGSPSPNQASILGGLLAGFGQVEGLTPGQVSQIVGPMLQAANKPLTAANLSSMLSSTQAVMTATPWSQSAAQLGVVSQIGLQQAIGGGAPQLTQTAAMLNAAIQTNSIWHPSAGVEQQATSSIQAGVQGAYGNPSQEAFMTMAGISYEDQRAGMTSANVTKIAAAATRQYGSGPTRDIMLRSMFGLAGADLIETFSPGSAASKILAAHPHATAAEIRALQNDVKHPQAATTPSALANKAGGTVLGWLEASKLHAALGIAAGGALLKAPGQASKGIGRLLSRAAAGEDAAEAGAGDAGEGVLGGALDFLGPLGLVGGVGLALAASGAGGPLRKGEAPVGSTVFRRAPGGGYTVGGRAQGLGGGYIGTPEAGKHRGNDDAIGQTLSRAWQQLSAGTSSGNPILTFSQGAQTLLQAANLLKGGPHATGASYQLGSGGALGTSAIQALGALAPGAEFAALVSGAGSGGAGSMFASLFLSGGGGTGAGGTETGAGWSACTLTWYDPALGGINSGSGAANPHSPTASGTPYSAGANTCAAPPGYAFGTQISFAYGGKTVTCTVNDRGGAITGAHFDLARAPATTLGIIGPGRVSAKFKVLSSGSASSGSASGSGTSGASAGSTPGGAGSVVNAFASAAMMSAGGVGGGGGGQGGVTHIHNHIYIDGKEIRKARVLKGHRP
jgi:hypothetical protein